MAKKMCRIFNCDRYRENRCCFTCSYYNRCANHCLNSPRQCGLVKDTKPQKEHPTKATYRKEDVAT